MSGIVTQLRAWIAYRLNGIRDEVTARLSVMPLLECVVRIRERDHTYEYLMPGTISVEQTK